MGRVKVVVEAEAPEQSTHVKQQRKAHAHPRQAGKPAAKSKPDFKPDFKPHVAVPGAHPIPRSRQKQGGKPGKRKSAPVRKQPNSADASRTWNTWNDEQLATLR